MQQLSEFVVNHWILVTAFCAVAGLLVANFISSVGGLSPTNAVMLINREQALVLDVRPAKEFATGHIGGAINVPPAELTAARERLAEYQARPVVVCCASGTSAGATARQLKGWGFQRAQVLAGGIAGWRAANLPLTED